MPVSSAIVAHALQYLVAGVIMLVSIGSCLVRVYDRGERGREYDGIEVVIGIKGMTGMKNDVRKECSASLRQMLYEIKVVEL